MQDTITFRVHAGTSILQACQQALKMAGEAKKAVTFDFNDVQLVAEPLADEDQSSRAATMAQGYLEECRQRAEAYSNSEEGQAAEDASRVRAAQAVSVYEAAMAKAPAQPLLKDPDLWEQAATNNQDPLGARVMKFAHDWAVLMEARMAEGESLPDVIEECGRIADYDGITGFMYACAKSLLVQAWEHGAALQEATLAES